MNIRITPRRSLTGEVRAIASKSDAHRCIICAALSDSPTTILLEPISEDITATIECVVALGATAVFDAENRLIITPIAARSNGSSTNTSAAAPTLDCRESGSTLRFLLPTAAALCARVSFAGSGRLPDRPLSPLIEEMESHGCTFSSHRLPFTVNGKMTGGQFTLPGNISSQFISGLLMALPITQQGGEICLTTASESTGYIEMTIDTMRKFGIDVESDRYSIKSGQFYRSPGNIAADGDWSNIAFWITAGALYGEIACSGLNPNSIQGDRRIVEVLKRMGADITWKNGILYSKRSVLNATEIDATDIPDLIPILAVAAAVADGTTVIKNAGRLRIKESDRLHTIADSLSRIGAQVKELEDGLQITGKKRLVGGRVHSFNDHRIAMAMAVASTVCEDEVFIENAEAVNKSYPRFFRDFEMLGGQSDVIDVW